jgi:predicted nucleotidyltransferase
MEASKIIKELKIEGEVLNIYPYGSRVYGTANENSDSDFIIVMKSAFLDSGSFKDNAISNEDGTIQGVLYSRGGFIDAINNYEISALECLFLDGYMVVMKKWPFKLQKLVVKDMVKKIIQKASNSWHIAKFQFKDDEIERAKKGVFHAIRILEFGRQLKEHSAIIDYSSSNELKHEIDTDDNFSLKKYINLRDNLIKQLRDE